jgi:monoamine oxidase
MMENTDVIIIGAGATGLMAAYTLAKAGKQVIVLEARNRCGGRIHTLNNESFFKDTELGAEFVHGDLPVTLNLLKKAGIAYEPASAEMWHYKNGKFSGDGGFHEMGVVIDKLEKLKTDLSIHDFLENEFAGDQYKDLKESVIRFVSGYDTADPYTASSFALRDEWSHEDEGAQHRVKGGYGKMISFLEDECKKAGVQIYLNCVVKKVEWQEGKAKAITADGSEYTAGKIIIALPLGVLQADKKEQAAITFYPEITAQSKAITAMGFGAIIKILLEFDELFWTTKETEQLAGASLVNMGFLLSDEEIPTWWTQVPQHSAVLTGWLGGPPAAKKVAMADHEILDQSLQSLANIFKKDAEILKDKLVAFNIVNWTADPFTLGSYAYDTVAAAASRNVLNEPVNDTLFFAGEYLYEGAAMGTVEAALTSGQNVAKRLIELG